VHRGDAWHEGGGESSVSLAAKGLPLSASHSNGVWRVNRGEAQFHPLQHQFAHHRTADAGIHRMPSDDDLLGQ
jgi:hypothetical protein